MQNYENKLIIEIETLQEEFNKTTSKLIKDVRRQDKIMVRSDKRQQREYDELQSRLEEVQALQNAQSALMDSFVHLLADAIDAKSKYTGGHCSRVPILSMMLVKEASLSQEDAFKDFKLESEDELRELKISALLHDCGKIITPENIVDKATKLETIYNRIHEIRTRFEVIHRDLTIEALEKKLSGENIDEVDLWLADEHKKLIDEFSIVANANVGTEFMKDSDKEKIKEIAQRCWIRNFDDTLGLAHEEKQRVLLEKTTTPSDENLLSDKQRHIIPRDCFDSEEYEVVYTLKSGELYFAFNANCIILSSFEGAINPG